MGAVYPLLLSTVLLQAAAAQGADAATTNMRGLSKETLAAVLAEAHVDLGDQESLAALREKVQAVVRREPQEEDLPDPRGHVDDRRVLTCACSTPDCLSSNTTTCLTEYKCYAQYLDKNDGSDPVSRGCVSGNTPILCENRHPLQMSRRRWPYLVCCDTGDLCNDGPLRPPSLAAPAAAAAAATTGAATTRGRASGRRDAAAFTLGAASRPVVLSVLFAGLAALFAVMGLGFHVLSRQSLNMQQRYSKAPTGDTPSLLESPSGSEELPVSAQPV